MNLVSKAQAVAGTTAVFLLLMTGAVFAAANRAPSAFGLNAPLLVDEETSNSCSTTSADEQDEENLNNALQDKTIRL